MNDEDVENANVVASELMLRVGMEREEAVMETKEEKEEPAGKVYPGEGTTWMADPVTRMREEERGQVKEGAMLERKSAMGSELLNCILR